MDLDQAREVIRTQNRAVLATFRADGPVQMSAINRAGLDRSG